MPLEKFTMMGTPPTPRLPRTKKQKLAPSKKAAPATKTSLSFIDSPAPTSKKISSYFQGSPGPSSAGPSSAGPSKEVELTPRKKSKPIRYEDYESGEEDSSDGDGHRMDEVDSDFDV
jgi:hypothetical protein